MVNFCKLGTKRCAKLKKNSNNNSNWKWVKCLGISQPFGLQPCILPNSILVFICPGSQSVILNLHWQMVTSFQGIYLISNTDGYQKRAQVPRPQKCDITRSASCSCRSHPLTQAVTQLGRGVREEVWESYRDASAHPDPVLDVSGTGSEGLPRSQGKTHADLKVWNTV